MPKERGNVKMKSIWVLLLLAGGLICHVQAQNKTDLLVIAEKTLIRGDSTLAVKQFEEILTVYPQSFMAARRLAEMYNAMGDYHKAMLYCNIALDITENYQTQSTDRLAPSHALDSLTAAKEKEKIEHYIYDRAEMHHLKGHIRMNQQRGKDAIAEFKKSLEIIKTGEVMNSLALAYLQTGYSQDAIQLLHQAIAMAPENYKSYYNLANVYFKLQNQDSAVFYYQKTIAIDPTYKWPYFYNGLALTRQEHYEKALENFDEYIQRDSANEEAFFRRAVLRSELRQWEGAIHDWQKILDINRANADAWRNLGLSYFQTTQYDAAIESFDEALKLQPEEAYTYINRGYSYYLTDQPKMALADINKGLPDLPKYYLGYYFRALTYLQLGKKKNACKDAKRAISLGMGQQEMDDRLQKKCF